MCFAVKLTFASTLTLAKCRSLRRVVFLHLFAAKFIQTNDQRVQHNEFFNTLSPSKLRCLQNMPPVNRLFADGTVQTIVGQLIPSHDRHRKHDYSHDSRCIFLSYDSTAVAEQEKTLCKKAAAVQ